MPGALSTVLIAALTSGVVAFGIEWLFKPRLEARKERLLELHRKRRAFESQMTTIMVNIAKWSAVELPGRLPENVASRLMRDKTAAEQQVDAAISAMNEDIFDVVFAYATQRIRNLIIRYIFVVRLVLLSDRAQPDRWSILLDLTQSAHAWLFSRFWRFRSRWKALFHLMKALDELSAARATEVSSDEPATS